MGFFDGRRQADEDESDDDWDDGDVLDSPSSYLGGVVPLELLIARSDSAAIAVRGLVAYPDGFEFTLAAWVRRPTPRKGRRRIRPIVLDSMGLDGEEPGDDFLRFGIEFPDGASVTNLDATSWDLGPDATEPLHGMESSSGGGSDSHYEQEWWAWPIPGPGELHFVCEWPLYGIAEARSSIDAELIRDAAARAQPLWPDEVGRSHLTRGDFLRRTHPGQGDST